MSQQGPDYDPSVRLGNLALRLMSITATIERLKREKIEAHSAKAEFHAAGKIDERNAANARVSEIENELALATQNQTALVEEIKGEARPMPQSEVLEPHPWDRLVNAVIDYHAARYPSGTHVEQVERIVDETEELVKEPESQEEAADVLLATIGYFARRGTGREILSIAANKMMRVASRTPEEQAQRDARPSGARFTPAPGSTLTVPPPQEPKAPKPVVALRGRVETVSTRLNIANRRDATYKIQILPEGGEYDATGKPSSL